MLVKLLVLVDLAVQLGNYNCLRVNQGSWSKQPTFKLTYQLGLQRSKLLLNVMLDTIRIHQTKLRIILFAFSTLTQT